MFVKLKPEKLGKIYRFIRYFRNEKLLVIIIITGGSLLRFFPLIILGTDFPNDYGGLFLEFANQIAINDFLLPKNIPFYTNGGIPFAYPPLSFYIEGIAIHKLDIAPYVVVNTLPPFFTILSLPSFYYLTLKSNLSKRFRITSLAFFTIMPNSFLEQITGGGLAEALGTLVLIWFFISLYRTFNHNKLSHYVTVGFSWALCVLSSPGSAYASVPCFLLFAIVLMIRERNLNTLLHLTLTGIVALLLSSPYWLTVIRVHGIGVYLDSLVGQHQTLINTFQNIYITLPDFKIISGSHTFLWNSFLLLGGVISYFKRKYLLLGWYLILALIPREGGWMLSIPAALIIGEGLETIVRNQRNKNFFRLLHNKKALLSSGILLMVFWLAIGPITSVIDSAFSSKNSLDSIDVEAMDWILNNTEPNIKVVVITEDHILEWVPQISRRTVINIPFGSEWQPDEADVIFKFRDIVSTCTDLKCVLSISQMIVDTDQFLLFIDKVEFYKLHPYQKSIRVEFDLLWENKKFVVGKLSEN